MDDTARRFAAAELVQRLAARHADLAEHALATGALAARIAHQMGLAPEQVAEASLIGTLHEVGAIVVPAWCIAGLEDAPASEVLRVQRVERDAAVSLVNASAPIADLAGAVGSLFDDVVPTTTARIVVVADQCDYLLRSVPGRRALTRSEAIELLERHAGARYDRRIVWALADAHDGVFRSNAERGASA
jgi:HD-GYP domain-containing protein (c-di-GMP phosphodiesterase class II)